MSKRQTIDLMGHLRQDLRRWIELADALPEDGETVEVLRGTGGIVLAYRHAVDGEHEWVIADEQSAGRRYLSDDDVRAWRLLGGRR